MLRHLPPTAVPLTLSDLKQGLTPDEQALARFQEALSRYLGVHTCMLVASGRTALYLLLKQLAETAVEPQRREVILPAYTCPALAKVALDLALRPRLVDISPATLAFDLEALAAHLSERTLAVICVHPFGLPQAVAGILPLTQAVGAVLIEDAAQAMGARIGGKPVGTQGEFGLFSLGPGKPLSTGGGGVLCARDRRNGRLLSRAWEPITPLSAGAVGWTWIRQVLLMLAFHPFGWWLVTRAGLHRAASHQASWGYKLQGLSPVQAHVGLKLLKRLDTINQERRTRAGLLIDRLGDIPFVHILAPAATSSPIYLRLPLLVDSAVRRERLVSRLWAAGIGVGRMYEHTLLQIFPSMSTESYPGADEVARQLLTLPTHHYLMNEDIVKIDQIFANERSR